jgi:hypothetical protein
MGLHTHGGTMHGALTPICNSCGVSLCWDISVEEGRADQDFWDQWQCEDCNGSRMSLEQWRLDHPKIAPGADVPKVSIIRNHGHPWDGRPGFDLLYINPKTEAEMARLEKRSTVRHWHHWLVGTNELTGLPGGVFYKPCGITSPWIDEPENPHPGRIAQAV